ncbi:unnamed protein product [Strongylus vulgaris]|uniref:Uncharacterized protein n=1 Tax=Strongylus vulgaris TaxID=40348 RepID=A0A3P7J6V4_STRVU|nr:unnamed protein product [Strongylus vulgaris]
MPRLQSESSICFVGYEKMGNETKHPHQISRQNNFIPILGSFRTGLFLECTSSSEPSHAPPLREAPLPGKCHAPARDSDVGQAKYPKINENSVDGVIAQFRCI